MDDPDALAFDSSGNLYVANDDNSTVEKFAPGSTTSSATYSAGVSEPEALAFDASGNLYVANGGNNTVRSSRREHDGQRHLLRRCARSRCPGVRLQRQPVRRQWLYWSAVSKFAPGSTTASATYSAGVDQPEALAFDSSGNLYVANAENSTVEEFAPGSTTASATYSAGVSFPEALAFDSSGNLYVANEDNSTVEKFAPGSTPAAGGVVIQSSVESRPMLIGGTNNNPVAGINLTSAELAQIITTSTGTVTIGDSQQTGNITFSTATPATTAGAVVNVVQSTAGAGQIILDDGAGTATALNGNGGNISITAGTGGIAALAASNSTAEIATTGASVTLFTSGPIGTSTNRIQFADDSDTAQQVVSIGSTSIQPSSVYLDGLGSLTLGNILGGASNATIDVTARTNLTVSTGATINSGTSTLSLGADLTAAKTGDNGVGTLSINAGATVTSSDTASNAITLRGADVNIDTSSNPAVVGASRQLGTTPSATYSADVSDPTALAFDSSGNLYVANRGNGTVSKFAPGSTTASATYSAAGALAFDSSGNLYVANEGNNTVSSSRRGARRPAPSTPPVVLSHCPGSRLQRQPVRGQRGRWHWRLYGGGVRAGEHDGQRHLLRRCVRSLWPGIRLQRQPVRGQLGQLYGEEFAPGSTTASATYSAGVSSPYALAFDSSGNLYVANGGNSTVRSSRRGARRPAPPIPPA